jgi:hypothetical protein
VAAWVPVVSCDFYLEKNHKIADNSMTFKRREKISTDLESVEFYKCFDVSLDKFENNQILLYKISHRFLVTNKLFIGQKTLVVFLSNSILGYRQNFRLLSGLNVIKLLIYTIYVFLDLARVFDLPGLKSLPELITKIRKLRP